MALRYVSLYSNLIFYFSSCDIYCLLSLLSYHACRQQWTSKDWWHIYQYWLDILWYAVTRNKRFCIVMHQLFDCLVLVSQWLLSLKIMMQSHCKLQCFSYSKMTLFLVNKPFILYTRMDGIIKHFYCQKGHVYRLIPFSLNSPRLVQIQVRYSSVYVTPQTV